MCLKSISADLVKVNPDRLSRADLKIHPDTKTRTILDENNQSVSQEDMLKRILNSHQFSRQIRRGVYSDKEIILIAFYYQVKDINEHISSKIFAILEIELSSPDITSPDVFGKMEIGDSTLN